MKSSRVTVVRYEPSDPRLGRHVEHDDRSKSYSLLSKAARPKRINTFWGSSASPLDQGEIGSCTGNAMAQWLNTDFAQKHGSLNHTLNEADALDIYDLATTMDNIPGFYPPDDTGSTGNAAAKAARKQGYISGYSWLFSYTSIQAAIELTPLSVGTLWTNDMFNPLGGLVRIGSLKQSNLAGGHQYLMVGIDYDSDVFLFRNSWGEWPGAKPGGYFAISFRDFVQLINADGDVTVPKLT